MESKCHALERQQKELQQQLEEARAELETTAAVRGDGMVALDACLCDVCVCMLCVYVHVRMWCVCEQC